jgi:hypothetical protein
MRYEICWKEEEEQDLLFHFETKLGEAMATRHGPHKCAKKCKRHFFASLSFSGRWRVGIF